MNLAIPAWEIPTLAVAESAERFPVRRVFCMGLNYLDHKKEMGITGDVPPFMFAKAVNHVVPCKAGEITDISQIILKTPGIIAWLSDYYTLEPGDIIMTGTPGGIGPAKPGDVIEAGIADLPVLKVRVVA